MDIIIYFILFFQGVIDEFEAMGAPRFNKTNAEYDARRKRAKILGYFEDEHGEPVAKQLKFDESVHMEIVAEAAELVDGKPPLPLIDITMRPPSPAKEESEEKDTMDEEVFDQVASDTTTTTEDDTTEKNTSTENESEGKVGESRAPRLSSSTAAKDIDETTYRHWFTQPFTSEGLTYTMYTPPPQCLSDVVLTDLPKGVITDIDREPWKTSNVSWYFPLYGDLAAPTGTFDNIRTLLKDTQVKRKKRKSLAKK